MKALTVCLGLLFSVAVAGSAQAVYIAIGPESWPPTPGEDGYAYSLQIRNEGIGVSAINLVLVGFTSVAFHGNASLPDCAFVLGVLGDDRASFVMNAPQGQALFSLSEPDSEYVTIATLYTPHPYTQSHVDTLLEVHTAPIYFSGPILLGMDGEALDWDPVYFNGVRHVWAPEPSAAGLGALVLFALWSVRSSRA